MPLSNQNVCSPVGLLFSKSCDDGRRDGEFTFWYRDGQAKFQGSYLSGQVVDTWTLWHSNSQKYKETNTIRCTIYSYKPKGTRLYWHDNGQIKSKQMCTSDFNEYKSADVDDQIADVLEYLKKWMLDKMS